MADPGVPAATPTEPVQEPGWYHDDHGLERWWNGSAWDIGAPSSPEPPAPPPGFGTPPGYAPPYSAPPPGYAPPYPGPPPGYAPPYSGPAPGYGAPPPGYGPGPMGPAGYPPPPGYAPGPYYAPPAARFTDNRSMAMFSHLGVFMGGFLLPLIIYSTTGKTDPFVRHHSAEALNFSLAYLIFVFVGMLVSLVTLGIGFFLFLPLLMIVAIAHVAFAVMGAVKANQGEWWRYPVNIRFVSGAV